MSMIKEERLQLIIEHVARDGKVLLGKLSADLQVSEDTIRRDIKELSDRGLLKAVRGGAVAHSPIPHHFRDREKFDKEQKIIMAAKALQFLKDGQVVLFDGGTSTLAIAEYLPADLKITVITNSFPVATVLEDHPNTEVIFIGGRMNKLTFTTTGYDTIQSLSNIRAEICFLSVCSIHLTMGVTALDYEDSQVKKAMVEMSKRTIAISTLSKINTAESYRVCPVTDLDTIITDVSADNEQLNVYREAGIGIV